MAHHLVAKALLIALPLFPRHVDPGRALYVLLDGGQGWEVEWLVEKRDPVGDRKSERFSAPFSEFPGWMLVRVVIPW
jgi:hypothetical protein